MSRRRFTFAAMLLATTAGALAQSVLITTTSPLPTGYVGVSYVDPLTAVSNPPNQTLTWSFPGSNAALAPPGITLSANGNYFGTPTVAGTYTFTIAASFGSPSTQVITGTQQFSITIIQPKITITTSTALPTAVNGQSYSATFTATNNTSLGTAWSATNFPPGLAMNPSTGVLSGSPLAQGSFVGTVTATINGTNYSASQTFPLAVVAGQVQINTISLPLATVAQSYSAQLQSTPPGATWTLLGGTTTLPQGIALSSSGAFSGTPTVSGAYPLMLQADLTESNYAPAQATLTLYVTTGPLKIVQNSIPVAIQNVPYQATLTPSGGLAPYHWTTQNSLGMTIGFTSGIISGTPSVLGPQSLPVTLTDSTGTNTFAAFSFFVAAPLTVQTTSLPNGIVGQTYNQTLAAGGGQAPYVWSIPTGSSALPPPGLSLSPGGAITGTPTANGSYSFTVQVADSGQRVATKSLSITVIASTIAITTASLPDGVVGSAYLQALAATGGTQPYTWALAAGSLPAGITLDPKSGTLSGTPVGPGGPSNFTIQITDSTPGTAPLTAQKAFTLNIAISVSITTATLPNGSVGVAYPQTTLAASGGKPPYTWSIASGQLPDGLQLGASTGTIGGTPTAAKSFIFAASVTDSGGQSAQRQYSIAVAAGGPPLTITTGNLSATVGAAFSTALAASGGTSPYNFALTNGTLPAGLTFSGGTIGGTPTAAGTSSLTFTVTDANQQTASASITITVSLPGTPPVTFTVGSASQPPVTLCLTSAFPVAVTATLTLSFQAASSVAVGTDQSVQFASPSHGSTVSFTLPPCTQTTPSAVVTQGTVAGTITITAKLSANGADVTPPTLTPQTIPVAAAPPVIQSVKLTPGTGSVTVTVTGYSSTREMVSGLFHFAPATGSTLSQSDITVQLGPAFTTWYQSAASNAIGSQFQLTIPFTVSGTPANVVAVTVTLTNTKGASAAVTSQ